MRHGFRKHVYNLFLEAMSQWKVKVDAINNSGISPLDKMISHNHYIGEMSRDMRDETVLRTHNQMQMYIEQRDIGYSNQRIPVGFCGFYILMSITSSLL
jgi:hypothetical protein